MDNKVYLAPNNSINTTLMFPSKTIDTVDSNKLELRKRRMFDFWQEEKDSDIYTIDDYDKYLDGYSFKDINLMKYFDNQNDYIDTYNDYIEIQSEDYRNDYYHSLNKSNNNPNVITLPLIHLYSYESFDEPWKWLNTKNKSNEESDLESFCYSESETDNETDNENYI